MYQPAPLFYFFSANGESEFNQMANSYNDISWIFPSVVINFNSLQKDMKATNLTNILAPVQRWRLASPSCFFRQMVLFTSDNRQNKKQSTSEKGDRVLHKKSSESILAALK